MTARQVSPYPDHISAKPEDLHALIEGLATFDNQTSKELDTVIAAAVLAFGFVYIHPFEDGNGRIHRYLMHHVLSQREFTPAGVVFPVSAAILDRIDDYRKVLEDYSRRLLPLIEWQPTEDGNVRVLNDTADFYRFFDATTHAEFFYSCVQKTVEEDLPQEAEFLARYDRFRARVEAMVDMPERTLICFSASCTKTVERCPSVRAKMNSLSLTQQEAADAEAAYREVFQPA